MHKVINVKSGVLFPVIKEILDKEGRVSITVTGNSMYPFLRGGKDSVELSGAKYSDVKNNDIVLVLRDNGEYVLHRIIYKEKDSFCMIGDAQQQIEGPLRPDQIFAVAVAVYRDGKRIDCSEMRWKIASASWVKVIPYRFKILKIYRRIKRVF